MDYFFKKKSIFHKIKNNKKIEKDRNNFSLVNCENCKKVIIEKDLKENLYICPECKTYLKVPVKERLDYIFDKYEVIESKLDKKNPLNFPGYEDKLKELERKTGLEEAIVVVKGKIKGYLTYAFFLDSSFLMGSLSRDVGHKITECFKLATKDSLPVVSFVASGGARMQEGIFSLLQMANTTFALEEHSKAGNLYISVMTNPTTGGVTASFASLGNINLSEPGAMICFTGPRVIEQTLNKKLPEGFQSAEFLLDRGFLDKIVERKEWKNYLGKILEYHKR